MTAGLILLILSAMLGTATGLTFKVQALIPIGLLIASASAIALHASDVGVVRGMAVIVGCLATSQFAYLCASLRLYQQELSVQDEIDGGPRDYR